MYKVIIIGTSEFGHRVAVDLRKSNDLCSITLISEENYPAYDRGKLVYLLNNSLKREDLFFCKESFYLQHNINFLKGEEVVNINPARKLVYLKNKDKLSYDFLVIATDRKPILPDIPGIKKREVYNPYFLDEVERFKKQLINQDVCIVGLNELALKFAEIISEKFKVEVKLISKNSFDNSFTISGVEIIKGTLQEIIGEGSVQAIKIKEGKVIGVCAVLFMDNYHHSNIEFLKNREINIENDFIVVDDRMRTNIENIFSIGSIANRTDLNDVKNLVETINKHMEA